MNDKVMNVAVVGFFGSGSSAVIDLLKEYDNCGIALGIDERGIERPYEHKLLYSKGGLFETSILLRDINTAYGSDIYINSFMNNMKRLYYNNFVSFGSYKKLLGDVFIESIQLFLRDLGVVKLNNGLSRSEHKIVSYFSPLMAILQIAAKVVYNKPIYKFGKSNLMNHDPYYFCMPRSNDIYDASRLFIDRYFDMCYQQDKKVMIYDQLIHPQHVGIVDDFFYENFRAIIVKRDPRDVFCLSKYVWSKPPHGFSAPLPNDAIQFADFWKKITKIDSISDKVLVISFEDLVYQYEETKQMITRFIGLNDKNHNAPQKYFDPRKSIRNTQLFLRDEKKQEESKKIAQLLPNLLYSFPYEIEYSMKDTFEDMNEYKGKNHK